jgi:hypothetical protein
MGTGSVIIFRFLFDLPEIIRAAQHPGFPFQPQ